MSELARRSCFVIAGTYLILDGVFLLRKKGNLVKPFFLGWIFFKIYHVFLNILFVGRFNLVEPIAHFEENRKEDKEIETTSKMFTFMAERTALIGIGGFEIMLGFMLILGTILLFVQYGLTTP